MLYAYLAAVLLFAVSLGFGGIQTWNLRACQKQSAKVLAAYSVKIAQQNDKIVLWEQRAAAAGKRAAEASKKAVNASKASNVREQALISAPKPAKDASCEAREKSALELIYRFRAP